MSKIVLITGASSGIGTGADRVLSLGPVGMARYLRDSRLGERVLPRLRAKLTGAF